MAPGTHSFAAPDGAGSDRADRVPSLSTAGPRSASGGSTPRGGAGALHPAFGPAPGAGSTAGSLAELLQLPAPQQSDLPATLQPPAPDRPPSMHEIWAQVRPVPANATRLPIVRWPASSLPAPALGGAVAPGVFLTEHFNRFTARRRLRIPAWGTARRRRSRPRRRR